MGCGPVDVARLSILYLPRYYCAGGQQLVQGQLTTTSESRCTPYHSTSIQSPVSSLSGWLWHWRKSRRRAVYVSITIPHPHPSATQTSLHRRTSPPPDRRGIALFVSFSLAGHIAPDTQGGFQAPQPRSGFHRPRRLGTVLGAPGQVSAS